MMIRRLFVLTMALMVTGQAGGAEWKFTGKASAGDQLLYTEAHQVNGQCEPFFVPQNHQVTYTGDGEGGRSVDAEKTLTYKQSPLRPEFDFRQPNFNERMSLSLDEGQASIRWEQPGGSGTKRFQVEVSNEVVIDAGFVHLIRKNWETLTEGGPVDFRFMGPTRGAHYAFVAEPTDHEKIDAHLTLAIKPSGMILRWLVEPIFLGFDSQGRLTDYLGLTNIRRNADRNYTAHIRYSKAEPPCPLLP